MTSPAPKVLILLGSPRRAGNTAALAARIAEGAEEAGAQVESIRLNALKISPCQACDGCRRKEKGCVVDDDMQGLYTKIKEADALVYASPVYWFSMSAQMKAFMDRCYAFGVNKYNDLRGKKTAVAMSFGDRDAFESGCVNALRAFQDSFRYTGTNLVGMVYGSADGAGEIKADTDLMDRAKALGRSLVLTEA